MTHDKFCIMYKDSEELDELYDCDCTYIQDIRFDQGQKIAQALAALHSDWSQDPDPSLKQAAAELALVLDGNWDGMTHRYNDWHMKYE